MRRTMLLIALVTLGGVVTVPAASAGAASRAASRITMANVTSAHVDLPTSLVAWVHPGDNPAGTVTFYVKGVRACAAKVAIRPRASAGRASCRATFRKLGTFQLRAAYSGNAHLRPSAVTRQLRVVKDRSRAVLSVTGGQVNMVTLLSARIYPLIDPAGTVTFSVNGAKTCTVKVPGGPGPSTGLAYCRTIFRKLGTIQLKATYSGNAHMNPASATEPVRIGKQTTFTTVQTGATGINAQLGATLHLAAQVTAPSPASNPGPAPTGTVRFRLNGQTLCTATATADPATAGQADASCDWTPGTYLDSANLTAVYSGDATQEASASPGAEIHVGKDQPSLAITAPPVMAGGETTLTVTATSVYGGTPTGTVAFFLAGDGVPYPALCTATLSGGTGSCATAIPGAGDFTIVASYNGDGQHLAASARTPVTVSLDSTATSVQVTPGTVTYPGEVTLKATVAAPYETPSGTVTFSENGVQLCTASLSGGTAACLSLIPPNTNGGHTQDFTITATYSGDTYDASSAGTANLTVNY